MKLNPLHLVLPLALAGLMSSCATAGPTVPAPLMAARFSYVAANTGLTAELASSHLADARQTLDKANQEFATHGDTPICRDYSYIAQNKLELAGAVARTEMDRRAIADASQTAARAQSAEDDGARSTNDGFMAAVRIRHTVQASR